MTMPVRAMIACMFAWEVFAAAAAPAGAQTGVRQSGSITTSVGVGFGSATFVCPACLATRQLSLSGTIRSGMTLSSTWTVGLEGSLWVKQFQQPGRHSAAQLGFVDVAAQWYPAGGSEFFVSGGAGVALFHEAIHISGAPSVKARAVNPALALGLGWDIPIRDRWAVTPYMDFLIGGAASADVYGTGTRVRFRPALVQVGLAVTRLPPWRDAAAAWGLPHAKRPDHTRQVRSLPARSR